MHIADGVLSTPVLLGSTAIAAAGLAAGVRTLTPEKIPRVAVLSSAFFVGSLIHLPVGPTSVHLILTGLLGLILGLAVIPALFVALTLQVILFQFGGLTTLGANLLIMSFPAVLCHLLFKRTVHNSSKVVVWLGGFGAGFFAVGLSAMLLAAALALSGDAFGEAAVAAFIAHLPVMVAEGIFTGFCIAFLRRVKPELLGCMAYPVD